MPRLANPLLEISKYMSVNECRIFYTGLMALRNRIIEGRPACRMLLPTQELLSMFGGNKGYYQEIKKITVRLAERTVTFNKRRHPLFEMIEFLPEKGGLYMMFCPRLGPLMSDMSRRSYLPLVAAAAFVLSSMYGIRLLELLLQYQQHPMFASSGEIRVAYCLEDLKSSLNVPRTCTYEQITNLRHKVLNPAVVDINLHTGYDMSYEAIKEGRRVSAILLMLKPKQIQAQQPSGQQEVQQVSQA